MALSEEEFADLVAQVAGIPYEVEALPRKHGLAARGIALGDRLDEDLGFDDERRAELAVALEELTGSAVPEEVRALIHDAVTVGALHDGLVRGEALE